MHVAYVHVLQASSELHIYWSRNLVAQSEAKKKSKMAEIEGAVRRRLDVSFSPLPGFI